MQSVDFFDNIILQVFKQLVVSGNSKVCHSWQWSQMQVAS